MHGAANQINLFNHIFDGGNEYLRTIWPFDTVDIVAPCDDDFNDLA